MKHLDKKITSFFEKSFSSYKHFALLLFVLTVALSIPLGYSLFNQESKQFTIAPRVVAPDPQYSITNEGLLFETAAFYCDGSPLTSSTCWYCAQFTSQSTCSQHGCSWANGSFCKAPFGYECESSTFSDGQIANNPTTCSNHGCATRNPGSSSVSCSTPDFCRTIPKQSDCQSVNGCTWGGFGSFQFCRSVSTPPTSTPTPISSGGGGGGGQACTPGSTCQNNLTCTLDGIGCCPLPYKYACNGTCSETPCGTGGGGGTTVATNLKVTHIPNSSCTDNNYTVSLQWNGSGPNWYVDISEDQNFSGWSNKEINNKTSTDAPSEFSGGLNLEPDKTYYWRVWNGQSHSQTASFSRSSCSGGGPGGGGGNPDTCVGALHWFCNGVCYCQEGLGGNPECDEEVQEPELACPTGGFYQCTDAGLSCPTFPTGSPSPSTTVTVSPEPPTATATPVATTPGITTQPTATTAPNPTATTTPQPTATTTPDPNAIIITFNIKLPGVGSNTAAGQNPNPIRTNQPIEVVVFNAQNQQVKTTSGTLNYDSGTQSFRGTVALDNFSSGAYTIKSRFDNTLFRGQTAQITSGTNTLSQIEYVAGDIDKNNILDLIDYNALNSCYMGRSCSNQTNADLNIDGIVDEKDLNILLTGFATRLGD